MTCILRLYDPLASYFKSASMVPHFIFNLLPKLCILVILPTLCCFLIQDDNQVRLRRFKETFSDPMTEVYLLFFQATIPTFTSFNLLLQREQSIFLLHDEVHWEGGVGFCCCVLFLFGVICLLACHPLFCTCKFLYCR